MRCSAHPRGNQTGPRLMNHEQPSPIIDQSWLVPITLGFLFLGFLFSLATDGLADGLADFADGLADGLAGFANGLADGLTGFADVYATRPTRSAVSVMMPAKF